MQASKYLTVKQAAERLEVSTDLVYRLVQEGRLKALKIGSCWRIPAANLNPEALAKSRVAEVN